MKLKWKMGEKPTGRYRSSQRRSWPSAEYEDGQPAVALYPAEAEGGYYPSVKETTVLKIRIADYHDHTFTWVGLKARPVGLKEAKRIAGDFIRNHGDRARDVNCRLR